MDYYSILGINKNASDQDIRKAYKKQSMQHHPDRGGDEEKFKKINEAYSVLKDPQKRKEYDNPQPQWQRYQYEDFGPGGFDDLFNTMFNNRQRSYRTKTKNKDVQIQYKLSIENTFKDNNVITSYSLPSGRTETVEVRIPPGVKDGNIIKVAGYGDDSNNLIPRGDLLIKIRVVAPKDWRVEGNDIHVTKTINILDFILGTEIVIDTPEGKSINLRIPKGTNPGTTFSVTGHGLHNVNNNIRGKMLVKVNATVPKLDDETLIEKIRNIKDEINSQS